MAQGNDEKTASDYHKNRFFSREKSAFGGSFTGTWTRLVRD
ncbi:MAG: hypothetical protein V1709_05330 [Planctomycetota bacterium]